MDKIVIRKATTEDIPFIVEASLDSASRKETEGFSAPEWTTYSSPRELRKVWAEENRLKDGSQVIVAEEEENVVGFIVFKMERGYAYIDNIDIIKKEQRKGIGRTLVTHVEKIAISAGCSCIKTDTTENAAAVPWKSYGFWTKMGYEDTKERLPTKWDFKTIPFIKNLKQQQH
jgi:ribosomal protein S18 acetylase RimI-like enzyme